MATIIDSLKRLERAGSENSRATQKLREAAMDLAATIEQMAVQGDFVNVPLPRDYIVEGGNQTYLMSRSQGVDDYAGYPIRYAFYCGERRERPTRAAILEFSADIASGWLDELAEFIESRQAQSDAAAEVLEAAKAAMSE
jgi:hypothetical protein